MDNGATSPTQKAVRDIFSAHPDKSYAAIAREVGVTRERVRQILGNRPENASKHLTPIGLHLSQDLMDALTHRARPGEGAGSALRRHLVRYFIALEEERKALTKSLTRSEFVYLYEFIKKRRFGPNAYRMRGEHSASITALTYLWALIADRPGVTASFVSRKLKTMPFTQLLAAIDVIEQLRNAKLAPDRDNLKKLGLDWS